MNSNRKQSQRLLTQRRLVASAREIFTARGYAGAATEEIVRSAGVTRGALYHLFEGKAALFAVVFAELAAEVLGAVERAAGSAPNALAALKAGSVAFLGAATAPSVKRIYLVDAPSVLGWAHWRAVDARFAAASLRRGIDAVLGGPSRRDGDAEALTYFLSGALNEIALWVSENPEAGERAETIVIDAIDRLFAPRF